MQKKNSPCKGTEIYIDNNDGTFTLEIRGKKNDGNVLISEIDLERVKKHHWYIKDATTGNNYVATKIGTKTIKLHRFLFNLEYGDRSKIVDHINRNTLDNRRENLRVVGYSENNHNHRMNKNNSSGRKGVKYRSAKGNRSARWDACITINGKEYKKAFSVSTHGDEGAKQKAIAQREAWEKEFNILSEKSSTTSPDECKDVDSSESKQEAVEILMK